MKNIFKSLIVPGIALLLAPACSEQQVEVYHGPVAANIVLDGRADVHDSVEMSFLQFLPSVTDYTFDLVVRLQTTIIDQPRTVYLEVGESTAPEAGYEFPREVVIPAGEGTAALPVKVFRTSLPDGGASLAFEVVVREHGDFTGGVYGTMKVKYGNEYPDSWVCTKSYAWLFDYFLDDSSIAKYKIVYSVLGTIDVGDNPYVTHGNDWTGMYTFIDLLNAEIERIEAETGKPYLDDDNKTQLRF